MAHNSVLAIHVLDSPGSTGVSSDSHEVEHLRDAVFSGHLDYAYRVLLAKRGGREGMTAHDGISGRAHTGCRTRSATKADVDAERPVITG